VRLGVLILGFLGGACTQSARWTFTFDDPTVAESAAVVEARVLSGACDGPVVHAEIIERGATATMPVGLAPGRYGLFGEARDEECEVIARGCTPASFPAASGARFEVALITEPTPARPPACAVCMVGRCGGGSCPLDPSEPNETTRDAVGVELGTPADLSLCPDDADVVAFPLAAGEEVRVELVRRDGEGFLEAELLAPDGTVLATSSPTADGARVSGFAAQSGIHYTRVSGIAPPTGTAYALTTSAVSGTRYFMSPTGADAAVGSFEAPWGTFVHALAELQPGDTLVLQDGTYGEATAGLLHANCSAGARSGLVDAPVRVVALHERRAFLQASGTTPPIHVASCGHWVLEGLRAESEGSVVRLNDSAGVVLRRLLLARTASAAAQPALWVQFATDLLVEETELYNFAHVGIDVTNGTRVTLRRTYANHRGFGTVRPRGVRFGAAHDSLIENHIDEGNVGVDLAGEIGGTYDNRVLGTISLAGDYGFLIGSDLPDAFVNSNSYENCVAVRPTGPGLWSLSSANVQATHVTVVNGGGAGFLAGSSGIAMTPSFACAGCLSVGNAGAGYDIEDHAPTDWSIAASNAFGNGGGGYVHDSVPVSPGEAQVDSSSRELDPMLGGCLVYVPDTSPMRGAGPDGTDIGANVVRRYEDGRLTSVRLWHPVTGRFPCGAVVEGVNDDPATSCIGVHERLAVGTDGCPIP